MEKFSGSLFGFFETGTEGVLWALQCEGVSGYDGLVVLEPGDTLCIYDANMNIAFVGLIRPDYKIGLRKRPGTEHYQPVALGRWIHWTQEGFSPDEWAIFFLSKNYTGLLYREIQAPIV